jgi:hypothetical protein
MKKPEAYKFEEKQQKLLKALEEARSQSDFFKYDKVLMQLHKLRSQK